MSKIVFYSEGICTASICVDKSMTPEEIETELQLNHPSGTSLGWKISKDKHFAQGLPNPCQCERDENRMHYLLNC